MRRQFHHLIGRERHAPWFAFKSGPHNSDLIDMEAAVTRFLETLAENVTQSCIDVTADYVTQVSVDPVTPEVLAELRDIVEQRALKMTLKTGQPGSGVRD